MNIATLGIAIDPQKAVDGGNRIKEILKAIGQAAKIELKNIDEGAQEAGDELDNLGKKGSRGFADMLRGLLDFLDAFGLMDGAFGTMVRRTDSAVRAGEQLVATTRSHAVEAKKAGDSTEVLSEALGEAGGNAVNAGGKLLAMNGTMVAFLGTVLLVVAALGALALGFLAIKSSIPEAAALEQYEVRLAVAMGSFTEARKKLQELNKFSDDTPFQDAEVFDAGVKLEAMTRGALSSREALEAIGGAAVVAGKNFSEMAELSGRTFNAIQLGMDYIEPLKTMFSYGLISGPTVKQVIQLGDEAEKAGQKGANAAKQWALIYADLQQKSVALVLQSKTWDGLISTMAGKWDAVKASFGEPIMDALKPVLEDIIAMLPQLQQAAASFGQAIGDGIRILYQAVSDGTLEELIATTFMAGLETVADVFVQLFAGGIIYVGTLLGNALGEAADQGANAMGRAYMTFIEWLAGAINKVLIPASSAMEQLGLGSIKAIGPTGGWQSQNFFEGKPLSFGAAMESVAGEKGVGTTWRDRAAKMSGDLLLKNRMENPDFSDKDLGGLKPGGDPMNPESEDKKGGKGGKEEKPPKAKLVETEMEKLLEEWGDFEKQVDKSLTNIAQSIATNLTDAITGLINGTKDAKTAFTEMATAIINDIIRIVIEMTIQLAIAEMLAALGYTGQSFGWARTGTAHSGGVAGTNLSNSSTPKFHQGGMSSSEQMVKVEKGETILTRRRAAEIEKDLSAARSSRSSQAKPQSMATIVNVLDRQEIGDAVARNPGAVVNALSRNLPQVRKMIMTGQRP